MSQKTLKPVYIDAPPEKVFAVLCDVERWPEWTPTMVSVQRLDRGPLAIGSSAKVRQPKLRAAIWRVTELQEGRNFTWTSQSPGLRMTAGHLVEPKGAGSHVELTFEVSGWIAPLMSRLYGGLIEHYVATESQALKQRSESGSQFAAASKS
ncbi:MAG TPA: SRPBCC family protein [Steroidobacteraceae bacterium]|nr:SRPBCC family protein [Steroidobacteraceae bacterium]